MVSSAPDRPRRKKAVKKNAADLQGWNFDLSKMPHEGRFEALRVMPEVYRHIANSNYVINPLTGTMFVPRAWRKAR